jgi:phosphoribosylaminoimidazole carboxylase (NCAIR synthetase)
MTQIGISGKGQLGHRLPLVGIPPGKMGFALFGGRLNGCEMVLKKDDRYLHLYGKAASPGLEIGQVTFLKENLAELNTRLQELERTHINE